MSQDILRSIDDRLERIEKEVHEEEESIHLHPIIFTILVISFLIISSLWATAFVETLSGLHPRGELYYWEYTVLAIVLTVVLLVITHIFGFNFRMIEMG